MQCRATAPGAGVDRLYKPGDLLNFDVTAQQYSNTWMGIEGKLTQAEAKALSDLQGEMAKANRSVEAIATKDPVYYDESAVAAAEADEVAQNEKAAAATAGPKGKK